MDSAHRRMEIISILSARGHATMRELAWELDVTRRTIMNDIIALSFDYPIYTKPGEGGGVFITEDYKPYATPSHRQSLKRCADYTAGQKGKRRKFFSALYISTGRTSWNCSRTD